MNCISITIFCSDACQVTTNFAENPPSCLASCHCKQHYLLLGLVYWSWKLKLAMHHRPRLILHLGYLRWRHLEGSPVQDDVTKKECRHRATVCPESSLDTRRRLQCETNSFCKWKPAVVEKFGFQFYTQAQCFQGKFIYVLEFQLFISSLMFSLNFSASHQGLIFSDRVSGYVV